MNLGFVDLSTPERRAADCADEIKLNRRLCRDVYLSVVQVVEQDGGYRMQGWPASRTGGAPQWRAGSGTLGAVPRRGGSR